MSGYPHNTTSVFMGKRNILISYVFATILLGVLIFFSERIIVLRVRSLSFTLLRPVFFGAMHLRDIFFHEGQGPLDAEGEKVLRFEVERLEEENASLKETLLFQEEKKVPLKGVHVIFYGKEFGKEFLIIDQGRKNGIHSGKFVIQGNGILVGRIGEAGETYAKVEIVSNPGESYDVELVPLRIPALAKGLGGRAFLLELVPFDTPLHEGDFIVGRVKSAGSSAEKSIAGSFLLGEISGFENVSGETFKEVRGTLIAHPEGLSEVFIVGGD